MLSLSTRLLGNTTRSIVPIISNFTRPISTNIYDTLSVHYGTIKKECDQLDRKYEALSHSVANHGVQQRLLILQQDQEEEDLYNLGVKIQGLRDEMVELEHMDPVYLVTRG